MRNLSGEDFTLAAECIMSATGISRNHALGVLDDLSSNCFQLVRSQTLTDLEGLAKTRILSREPTVGRISRFAGCSSTINDVSFAEALKEIGWMLENSEEYQYTSQTLGNRHNSRDTRIVRFHSSDHTVHFEWEE